MIVVIGKAHEPFDSKMKAAIGSRMPKSTKLTCSPSYHRLESRILILVIVRLDDRRVSCDVR